MRDITEWLERLGLGEYAEAFAENRIDANVLPDLTGNDLKEMGIVAVGDRRKLLSAIAALSRPEIAPQPEIVTEPGLQDKASPGPTAERRQLTVMFCDLVGSTALSTRLDPEDMREVIRAYQNAVAGEIARFEGHVAKFMGDGILAYFGYPRVHEDEAERAVRAGLAVAATVGQLKAPTSEPLAARIGIATGQVVVGDLVGEGAAQEEAVVGETPNLASRLQAIAEPGAVIVSEASYRLLGDLFETADLGAHELKGFSDSQRLWRVMGDRAAISRFDALRSGALTPFVGRDQEIGLLLERWASAKEGDGQVVLVSGEAGIGKSRITRSLLEALSEEPHSRVRYQCSPHHVDSALYPVIRHMERAVGFTADETPGDKLDKLEALLRRGGDVVAETSPLIAALLSIPSEGRYPPVELTPQRQKQLTLSALVGQLLELAARQPVLMIFEDAHWADPTTLEFLDEVISGVAEASMLAVLTCRPEFEAPWGRHSHVTSLALNRLTRRQSEAMVTALTDGKPLPDEVLQQIVTKTDGMPLFIEELIKDVLESGLLREREDRYELAEPLAPLTIPSSLQDSLMARLDRLTSAKVVAQIGAAIGREFSYRLLWKVSGLDDAALEDALARLTAAELIFRRGAPPEASYVFKHALVQDAAHATLLKNSRRDLHLRIAEILESQLDTDEAVKPEVLALHFAEAEIADRSIAYWRQAGSEARDGSNYVEASRHYAHAVALVPKLPQDQADTTELDLQMVLGETYRATKGTGSWDTEQAFDRARALCDKLRDRDRIFHVVYGQFICNFNRPKLRDAERHAAEFVRIAAEENDLEAAITADYMIGITAFLLGDLARARKHLEHAVRPCNAERDRLDHYSQGNLPSGALMYLSWTLFALGFPEQAHRRCEEALEASKATSDFIYAMGLNNACYFDHFRRDVAAMTRHATASLAVAEEKGIFMFSHQPKVYLGWIKARAGDRNGPREMEVALKKVRSSGQEVEVPHQLSILAEGYLATGDWKSSLHHVEDALARVEATEERWYEAEIYRLKGTLLLQSTDQAAAEKTEALYERALAVARRQSARMWELRTATSLARLWRDQGKDHEAYDLLSPIYYWFTEGFDTADLKDAKALLRELA